MDNKLSGFEYELSDPRTQYKRDLYNSYKLEIYLNDRYVFGQKRGIFFRINIDKVHNNEMDMIIIDSNDIEELKTYNRWRFSPKTISIDEDEELKDFFELVNVSLEKYINQ